MKKKLVVWLLSISALTATAPTALAQKPRRALATPSSSQGNVDSITAAEMKARLTFVASDEMEGRDTPSRGLDTTARFIAMNLSLWGYKPVGDDNSYFQRIALKKARLDREKTRAEFNGRALTLGEDFTSQINPGSASGEMVYAGNGWYFPVKNINPYQSLDIKNKIVVIAGGNLPKGVSFRDLSELKEGVDWEAPPTYARKHGAKGLLIIPAPNALANWNAALQRLVERGSNWSVVKFQDAQPIPGIVASEKLTMQLFEGEKRDGAAIFKGAASGDVGESFELTAAKQLKFTVAVKEEQGTTQNVVAVLEGSDPKLKDEYVAMGAHYDHVGIATNATGGDTIYNGADDDGSGTVAVLSMAEAFANGPRPKRSLLFVWHCGEEKGLWGSKYVTDFPVIPLERIVAQLNIDMIGRSKKEGDTLPVNKDLSGPNEIYVIGSKMMSTELGALSEQVNSSFLKLSFNYKYDDPKDPNRFFFRSDHFNYARKGIPIIFYFDGVHEDYHKVSDHADKIDYQKMEKVTRTVFATAWALANAVTRPTVDKQLPAELMGN
ncbi:MAG: M28 family peptidase [Acidobacteriota bacterium]